MFVRQKSTPNSPRRAVQIVESVRDGQRIRQRIVRHVGIAVDQKELKSLLELAQHIKSQLEEEHTPTLFGPEKMTKIALQSRESEQKTEDLITQVYHLKCTKSSILERKLIFFDQN